jgi:hypothetical protein
MARLTLAALASISSIATAVSADPLSWTAVAKAKGPKSNGPIWAADAGTGRNAVALFGGWTGTDAAVKAWADALAAAGAFDSLDVGRIYAVPGPIDSGYSRLREVNTAALAADVIKRAGEQKPGLILVAAHSSGAFVADDFIAQLQRQQKKLNLLATVAFFKLDGGWAGNFTAAVARKLGGLFCVAAQCDKVSSLNFIAMTKSCPARFAKIATIIKLSVADTGCKAVKCCHDALVNRRPHNANNFAVVSDYSDYSNGQVQTEWLEQARARLEKLAKQ